MYLSLHRVYLVILKKTRTIADAWMDSATAVIHLSTLNVWITCNALYETRRMSLRSRACPSEQAERRSQSAPVPWKAHCSRNALFTCFTGPRTFSC